MIILDTHIWIWWVHGDPALPPSQKRLVDASEKTGIGVSAISCWEVAKLVENRRLVLPCSTSQWLEHALGYPGVRLLNLTPRICVESTELPGLFHRDPADQIIVATARVLQAPLVTVDSKILAYAHVLHTSEKV